MPQNLIKPMFIVFEGIDGSGKDTVLNRILPLFYDDKWTFKNIVIGSKFRDIVRTREPTANNTYGKKIIKKLQEGSLINYDPVKTAELYIQDRILHTIQIRNDLELQRIVLSSRYDLSTYAYQINMGVAFDKLYKMHSYNKKNGAIIPDLTIYFKISPKSALSRISKRADSREAFEKLSFLTKTAEIYELIINKIVSKDQRNIITINAEQNKDEVFLNTKSAIEKFIINITA